MTYEWLAELRMRRNEIENEMRARLDEVDRMIARAAAETSPKPRRRRSKPLTVGDIFEPPVLRALLTTPSLSTGELALLFPGKRLGPIVSAWKRRARSASVDFDELVQQTSTSDGRKAYSLSDEGRRVFLAVAATMDEAPATSGVG